MTKLRNAVASALSFAHLAGLPFASAKAEEDDKKDDDDKKAKSKAEDDEEKKDQDHEDGDAKAQGKDESDDDYAKRMEEEDKEDDKKSKSKAKSEDDDKKDDDKMDDDEDEMRGNSASASARRRERARCAAIFASKAAGRNPVLAANLAFSTSMTRKEALAVLEGTPAPANPASASRSSRNPSLGSGGVTEPSSSQATASRWDSAFAKVTPRRR